MKQNKIISLFFLILLSINVHALYDNENKKDLDYIWTEHHPVLTEYINENRERIHVQGKALFKNAEKYLPYIYSVAEEQDVPREIAVVAAIESAFNPTALSGAGAKGMWQFMKATAKDMGLKDADRKDWKKSTKAAITYLKWLASSQYNGDYELALLAYNGGLGRVNKAMKAHNTSDPWELVAKKALPQETIDYLPKFIVFVFYYHYFE
jgi:membrane-bound lytic murein transglycosylase D